MNIYLGIYMLPCEYLFIINSHLCKQRLCFHFPVIQKKNHIETILIVTQFGQWFMHIPR